MTIKEHPLTTIQNLPEDAGWEKVRDRIEFRVAVEKGLSELDAGHGVTVEVVEKELKEWVSR